MATNSDAVGPRPRERRSWFVHAREDVRDMWTPPPNKRTHRTRPRRRNGEDLERGVSLRIEPRIPTDQQMEPRGGLCRTRRRRPLHRSQPPYLQRLPQLTPHLMTTIWNWILARDMASTRLLAIAALVLNYLGFCTAKTPTRTRGNCGLGLRCMSAPLPPLLPL